MSTLSLDWTGDLNFAASPGSPPIELHSSTPGMVSPTQALAYATMACMAMDVVHVLTKGRHEFSALSVKCDSARADKPPRRYTANHRHRGAQCRRTRHRVVEDDLLLGVELAEDGHRFQDDVHNRTSVAELLKKSSMALHVLHGVKLF
jgi:putative redox protein